MVDHILTSVDVIIYAFDLQISDMLAIYYVNPF